MTPGVAGASSGAATVRVEGTNATIVPPTPVAFHPGSFSPLGDPGHSCPADSAAAGLELATLAAGTSWSGAFFESDYVVMTIGGETHPGGATDGSYWNFWYDHRPATKMICGQPLSPGDDLLFFPDCVAFSTFTCPAGFVSPNVLGMTAPAVGQPGAPITVTVTSYAAADGTPSPAGGATVSAAGGSMATTSPTGAATLTFPTAGTFTLRATAPHAIRSEPHTICVGTCAAAPPAPTPSGPSPAGAAPPRVHLAIPENKRYAHGRGPRTIAGHIDPDQAGLRDVTLRLMRVVAGGRCQAFRASKRKFVGIHCGLAHAPVVSIGTASSFAYALPARLGRGRYTVEVQAVDHAGRVDAAAPGRNEIVFRVA